MRGALTLLILAVLATSAATAVQARKVLDYEHRLNRVEKRLVLKVNPLEETEDDDGQPA